MSTKFLKPKENLLLLVVEPSILVHIISHRIRFFVAKLQHLTDHNPQDTRWTVQAHRPLHRNPDIESFQAQDHITSLLTMSGIPALSEHLYKYSSLDYIKEQAAAQGVMPAVSHVAKHGESFV